MPRINNNQVEVSKNSAGQEAKEIVTPQIVLGTAPVFIASVNRKLNTGNFESIDVSATLSLPMPQATDAELDTLKRVVEDTAAIAFGLVSQEVNQRYTMLKELRASQRGGRATAEEPTTE